MVAKWHLSVLAVCSAVLLHASVAPAQLNELKRFVRPSANSLLVVDVEKIIDSPIGKEKDWKKQAAKAYADGVSILPPDTSYAVLAAELDLSTVHPTWQEAIVRLTRAPMLENIARQTGGAMLNIGGKPAVELPGGGIASAVDDKTVVAMGPVSRQTFARWRSDAMREGGADLSPYLTSAFNYAAELGTPIILSIDLEGAFTIDDAKALLADDGEVLKKAGISLDDAAKALSAIQGATLGVTLNKRAFGKVKVDFLSEVKADPKALHTVFLAALERAGMPIDEFHSFTPKVAGKQFTMEGHLGPSGMRRLFSFFDRPPSMTGPAMPEGEKPADPQQEAGKVDVAKTKDYYHHLEDMLKDLRKEPDHAGAVTPGLKGVWCRNYAKKIERLPVLGVDPDLLDLSSKISVSLYAAADNITIGMGRSRERQTNVPQQYNTYTNNNIYGYGRTGWWGQGPMVAYGDSYTWSVDDTARRMRMQMAISQEERIKAFNEARGALENAESAVAQMRRTLTQKYNSEF